MSDDKANDIEEKEIPDGCTCHEEFVTKPCPVHYKNDKKEVFGQETPMIITDEHLCKEDPYGFYEGFKFLCPDCQTPSIMVNLDMGDVCCRCGKKVLVRSSVVTEYIRKLSALKKQKSI